MRIGSGNDLVPNTSDRPLPEPMMKQFTDAYGMHHQASMH